MKKFLQTMEYKMIYFHINISSFVFGLITDWMNLMSWHTINPHQFMRLLTVLMDSWVIIVLLLPAKSPQWLKIIFNDDLYVLSPLEPSMSTLVGKGGATHCSQQYFLMSSFTVVLYWYDYAASSDLLLALLRCPNYNLYLHKLFSHNCYTQQSCLWKI